MIGKYLWHRLKEEVGILLIILPMSIGFGIVSYGADERIASLQIIGIIIISSPFIIGIAYMLKRAIKKDYQKFKQSQSKGGGSE